MNTSAELTRSERDARKLLAAWNSGDLARLEAALSTIPESEASSAGEEERFELLREVARNIRGWVDEASEDRQSELKMSLGLLRHLARATRIQEASIEIEAAEATPELRLEMLACVQH
jgi:hypothetical protein